MLWYCRFKYQPGARAEDVRSRVLDQHDRGMIDKEKIRGWYNLAGGGAGFILIESDSPQELTDILDPYMDLVSWDVHATYELPYDRMIEHFRKLR